MFIYLQSSKDLLQPSSGGEERSVRALRDGPLAAATEWDHSVALGKGLGAERRHCTGFWFSDLLCTRAVKLLVLVLRRRHTQCIFMDASRWTIVSGLEVDRANFQLPAGRVAARPVASQPATESGLREELHAGAPPVAGTHVSCHWRHVWNHTEVSNAKLEGRHGRLRVVRLQALLVRDDSRGHKDASCHCAHTIPWGTSLQVQVHVSPLDLHYCMGWLDTAYEVFSNPLFFLLLFFCSLSFTLKYKYNL